jgi:serum/glucocorticoid-regulated kinase 2
MGICIFKPEGEGLDISSLRKNLFEYKYAVGRGGFGKVWRVSTRRIAGEEVTEFALKEMSKARVMHKKSIESVMDELKLLQIIKSKFIVNAHYAFQDSDNLYLVLDLLLGGDLRYHLNKQKKFNMA